jgi:hypothetical protein
LPLLARPGKAITVLEEDFRTPRKERHRPVEKEISKREKESLTLRRRRPFWKNKARRARHHGSPGVLEREKARPDVSHRMI